LYFLGGLVSKNLFTVLSKSPNSFLGLFGTSSIASKSVNGISFCPYFSEINFKNCFLFYETDANASIVLITLTNASLPVYFFND